MHLKKAIILFFLLNSTFVFANKLDSLLNVLQQIENSNTPDDLREKANTCQNIADWYMEKYSDQDHSRSYLLQSIGYREEQLKIDPSPQENDYFDLAELYRKMSLFEAFRGGIPQSVGYMQKCEALLNDAGKKISVETERYNELVFDFYHSSFALNYSIGNIELGKLYWEKAIQIAETNNQFSYLKMNLYSEIAVFYSKFGDHQKALEFSKKGLDLYEAGDNKEQPHDRFIHFVFRAYFFGGEFENGLNFIKAYLQYENYETLKAYLEGNPDMVTRSFFENVFLIAKAYSNLYDEKRDVVYLDKAYEWITNCFSLAEESALQNDGENIGDIILRPEEKVLKLLQIMHINAAAEKGDRNKIVNVIRILDTYQSSRLHLERISSEINSDLWAKEKELKNKVDHLNGQITEKGMTDELRKEHQEASYELAEVRKKTKKEKVLEQYGLGSERFEESLSDYLTREAKTLLVYYLDPLDTALYIMGVDSANSFFEKVETPIDFSEKLKRLYQLNSAVQTEQDSLDVQRQLNQELYSYCFDPIRKRIGTAKLLIYPFKEMSYLSFDALMDEDEEYLVQHYAVQYASSVFSIISDLTTRDYQSEINCYFPSKYGADSLAFLQGASDEVSGIEKEFSAKVYRDELATKSAFLKSADNTKIVHFSSHSIMNGVSPYYSYLVFHGENEDSLNRLYAYEIFPLEMNAGMVTLGSCNSGVGNFKQGIGIVSLANAFYYAGVPSTVSSLWNTQDQSSSVIILDFYKNLHEGYSKSESLQMAKLDYLETADKIKGQPFFWANYVLYGDDEPLFDNSATKTTLWSWISVGAVVIFLFLWLSYSNSSKRRLASKK